MKFTAIYQQVPGGYVAFVAELPGANTQGRTLVEARRNLAEAVELVLDANRQLAEESLANQDVIRESLHSLPAELSRFRLRVRRLCRVARDTPPRRQNHPLGGPVREAGGGERPRVAIASEVAPVGVVAVDLGEAQPGFAEHSGHLREGVLSGGPPVLFALAGAGVPERDQQAVAVLAHVERFVFE